MSMPESMRDPNPFHHAASLITKLDRCDLKALRCLIAEREQELAGATLLDRHRRTLKWVTLDRESGYQQARGRRGVYSLTSLEDVGRGETFSLSVRWFDDMTTTHMKTGTDAAALKAIAEKTDAVAP
jgi:hypothetical protein